MHECISRIDHHWFKLWLVACYAPSHYLTMGVLVINVSEILIEIATFLLTKMHE